MTINTACATRNVLAIRTQNLEVEGVVPCLIALAPGSDDCGVPYLIQTDVWECGPQTFELLIAELLEANVSIQSQRNMMAGKLRAREWELLYRDTPIHVPRYRYVPEGRLWP